MIFVSSFRIEELSLKGIGFSFLVTHIGLSLVFMVG
jgi:hypothetical protein